MNEILRYLNNYFFKFKETGIFKIQDNKITGVRCNYMSGQYILLKGSTMNDRVVRVLSCLNGEITIDKAFNEEYEGVIYSLAIPYEIKELENKIEEWKTENKSNAIVSESFEGYSYTKVVNKNGQVATWKDVFADELRPFRCSSSGIRYVKEGKYDFKTR